MAAGGVAIGFVAYRVSHIPTVRAVGLTALSTPAADNENRQDVQVPAQHPLPQTLPALTLPDPTGKPVSLSDFRGHPVIVNFWATWCAPCRREMPLLAQLQRNRHTQGLNVVGIAVDFASAVRDYIKTRPAGYPLMVGEDAGMAAIQQFGMEAVLPFSVFADADGRIIAVKVGELHADEADYILDTMQTLASGHQDLAAARAQIADRLRQFAAQRAKNATTGS